MSAQRGSWLVAALLLASAGAVHAATTEPPDPCALLSPADVGSAPGGGFGAPAKTVAPRPYMNTVQGTDCRYEAGHSELLFRIYFDPSRADATTLFAKLKMFYSPPRPVRGVGDEAYFDRSHGLHVRKGNVRYFPEGPENESKVTALAQLVAGRL